MGDQPDPQQDADRQKESQPRDDKEKSREARDARDARTNTGTPDAGRLDDRRDILGPRGKANSERTDAKDQGRDIREKQRKANAPDSERLDDRRDILRGPGRPKGFDGTNPTEGRKDTAKKDGEAGQHREKDDYFKKVMRERREKAEATKRLNQGDAGQDARNETNPESPALKRRHPEVNIRSGSLKANDAADKVTLSGFDIGKADLSKDGLREGSTELLNWLHRLGKLEKDVTKISITGFESRSVLPGNEFNIGWNRANAVRDFLVENGIPRSMISTNSFGSTRSPDVASKPEDKAAWRKVEVEITWKDRPVERHLPDVDKGPIPERHEDDLLHEAAETGRDLIGGHIADHVLKGALFAEIALDTARAIWETAKAGDRGRKEMMSNIYEDAGSEAFANLTGKDAEQVAEQYKHMRRVSNEELASYRFDSRDKDRFAAEVDLLKCAARRDMLEQVLGPAKNWAEDIAIQEPDWKKRKAIMRSLFDRAR